MDAIRTTLGPRGMDKLIVDNQGKGFSALTSSELLQNFKLTYKLLDFMQSYL